MTSGMKEKLEYYILKTNEHINLLEKDENHYYFDFADEVYSTFAGTGIDISNCIDVVLKTNGKRSVKRCNLKGLLNRLELSLSSEEKEIAPKQINREITSQIFISHSTKDKEIAAYFIDDILIGALGINHTDILCTSVDGTKIESGENWRDVIKDSILKSEVILLLITPNYKQSEICLNEMGAAWACGKKVLPLIVEPITYDSVGVVMDFLQIEKLNHEKSLDKIRDKIVDTIGAEKFKIRSDRWTTKKQEFLFKLENYIKENQFPPIISNDTYCELEKKYQDLRISYGELIKDKADLSGKIEILKELKDKEQVKAALKENVQLEERLQELIENVNAALSKFKPIIRTIIYNDYSDQRLHFKYTDYKAEIDQAIARGYIDEDYEVHWNTPQISDLEKALFELDGFLRKNDDFCFDLEEKYGIEIRLKNLDFWETVLDIKMEYDK